MNARAPQRLSDIDSFSSFSSNLGSRNGINKGGHLLQHGRQYLGMAFDFHSDHGDVARDEQNNESSCEKDCHGLRLRKSCQTLEAHMRLAAWHVKSDLSC